MKFAFKPGRRLLLSLALTGFAWGANPAFAQSIGDLNSQIGALSSQVNSATSNPAEAAGVIEKLDNAESTFAKIASSPKSDRAELLSVYGRLEEMLNRMYTTYKQKKEDCIKQVEGGGDCDYSQSEQLSLQALYPLSWLRFQGAQLYQDQPSNAKKLLDSAIDGFTESTLVIVAPELVRENLLGRAYCERELGKYDKTEYDKAIADFKQIMQDGPNTKQYAAAQQGLSTTFAAMGNMSEAEKFSKVTAGSSAGAQMMHLTQLFKAEQAASDVAKKAEYHKEAVDFMRSKENDKNEWAVVQAAVAQSVRDPIGEFGSSSDPFEKHLLASVLYSEKKYPDAAKYYLEAAHSGKYPKDYKYAADIYYNQRRYDLVEQLANELAKQPGNPDAQWAAYMRFKLPLIQFDQGGQKNQQQQQQWVAAANDYLKSYPNGQDAYEPRFRLAEMAQRAKQYAPAAQLYSQVKGNAEYEYYAKVSQAECYYLQLVEAATAASDKTKAAAAPTVNRDQLRTDALAGLQEALKLEPTAERAAPGQVKAIRDLKGHAIYMLVSLMQHQPRIDSAQVAILLANFEKEYPGMKDRFNDVVEWRLKAEDQQGQYPQLDKDVTAVLARSAGDPNMNDFLKELGLDFWKSAQDKRAKGDQAGAAADVKMTALTYSFFQDQVRAGKMQAKNLTGTLSILGKAYIDMNDVDRAETIFNVVVKADPGSPDANAGLARIAQAKKDYKNSLELWTRVESVAAESDDNFYEAKYNLAAIELLQGNAQEACRRLAETRAQHPNLGTPEMKAQWDALQRKNCLAKPSAL